MSRRSLRGTRLIRVGIILALMVISASVSTSGFAGQGRQNATKTVVLANANGITSLDFRVRAGVTPLASATPGYDKLVAQNPYTSQVVPYIATSWKVTPPARPKQIVFNMRRDVTCPNGDKITPQVVADSFENWFKATKQTNPLPKLFGNGPYKLSYDNKKWTFTFTTQTPFSTLLLGFSDAPIICPEGLAALAQNPNALMSQQYGSGPYEVSNFVPDVGATWRKRRNWSKWANWAPPGVDYKKAPETFTWQLVSDPSTLANMLATGQANLGFMLPGPNVKRVLDDSKLTSKKAVSYNAVEVWFNQRPNRPASNPSIRAALFAALDYRVIANAAFGTSIVVAPSLLRPTDRCYDKTITKLAPTGNIAKAQGLLRAAGYTFASNGAAMKDGKQLKIHLPFASDRFGGAGVYAASQWKKIGIDVDLVDTPIGTYTTSLTAGNFDASFYIAANYRVYPWFQSTSVIGPPPTAGSNYAATGMGNNPYQRAGLFATQRSDCVWAKTFQQLMLKDSIALPFGFPISYAFANKSQIASFPADETVPYPQWIKMK